MRSDILTFSKIGGACIECCVQITGLHPDAVRYAVVVMAAVIVRIRREGASEWIDPGTRADAVLATI